MDGKRLFSGSEDNTIKVWDLESGQRDFHSARAYCTASPAWLERDGKRLFSGSKDNTIKVWDLESGKEILTLAGIPTVSAAWP